MKLWTKCIGVVLTTLMLLATMVTLVLARGGGGVGGSLGGSSGGSSGGSFSGGSFSGGGFSGGYSGGYSGRGLGGFFPFPFFFWGGSTSGSMFGGIFSFLFLMLILYLVLKTLRSSRDWGRGKGRGRGFGTPFKPSPRPNMTGGSDFTDSAPLDLAGRPITNANNLQRFGKAINFTRENMRYYAETFPRWDRDFLIGRVRQVFFWLQDAWSRQDLSAAHEYVTKTLENKYRADLQGMKARGERNMIKEPLLNPEDIEFIHSHLDEETQHYMVMVSASLIDYTVDSAGRQIAGDSTHRLYYTEFWEFTWQNENWLLSNIFQEDALEVTKIARGVDE